MYFFCTVRTVQDEKKSFGEIFATSFFPQLALAAL